MASALKRGSNSANLTHAPKSLGQTLSPPYAPAPPGQEAAFQAVSRDGEPGSVGPQPAAGGLAEAQTVLRLDLSPQNHSDPEIPDHAGLSLCQHLSIPASPSVPAFLQNPWISLVFLEQGATSQQLGDSLSQSSNSCAHGAILV